MWIWSLGQEDSLEKKLATHSSILAWEISWTEEPGGLPSMGLQTVKHGLATKREQLSPAVGALREFLSISRLWRNTFYQFCIMLPHMRDPSSIPGLRRSPGEGNGNPLRYSCLKNSMD